jgi:RNA-directed DNA polymerase
MAEDPDHEYRSFPRRARLRPFQRHLAPEQSRLVHEPSAALKLLQRTINERLLGLVPLPAYVCGGVARKSILANAGMHAGAKTVVTIDIRDFFPSVTAAQVCWVWAELLGCSPEISALLTRLTTLRGRLPQGAPTSMAIGNLVLRNVDGMVAALCEKESVKYSRWVDDLTLSGDHPQRLIGSVIQVLRSAGFRVRHRKVKVMGARSRKTVTGVVLGGSPTVPRERLRWIRAGIHKLRSGSPKPYEVDYLIRRLDGEISYVAMVSPGKGNRLRVELKVEKERRLTQS